MSPRPIEEPDENENEPDENEPDENSPQTPAPTGSTTKDHRHTSSPSSPPYDTPSLPSSSNKSIPPSTLGPVIVAIVVILIIITCCILYCARVRRRMNDEQRTQTINGWTSFLSQFRTKRTSTATSDVHGNMSNATAESIGEKRNQDYGDRAFQHRMSKPPLLPPYDEEELRGERQPSIVFSPGWLVASNHKQNEAESKDKYIIDEVDGASMPLSPPPAPAHAGINQADPERLCPHQVTVDDPVASQKPNQKTLEP